MRKCHCQQTGAVDGCPFPPGHGEDACPGALVLEKVVQAADRFVLSGGVMITTSGAMKALDDLFDALGGIEAIRRRNS